MAHIIADENVQQALAGVTESVEVRTSDGILLGHYTPVDARQALMHARYKHLWDLEEAERIAAMEREGIPLAEVWKHIRCQEKNICTGDSGHALDSGHRPPGSRRFI